jgi:tetratricopeptide (TPR) repeat protein
MAEKPAKSGTPKTAKADSKPAEIGYDAEELVALARLDMDKGAVDQALLKLKQAFAEGEPAAEAASLMARLYAQLGLFKRAQEFYQRFLQANPGAMLERFQLGMTYFDGGQVKEALAIWDELLKETPNHPPALFYKALALAQGGNRNDARQMLDLLMKTAPADNLYFGRAREMLQALDAGRVPANVSGTRENERPDIPVRRAPKDPYQTEH